jgi:hypothetical protein
MFMTGVLLEGLTLSAAWEDATRAKAKINGQQTVQRSIALCLFAPMTGLENFTA